MLDWRTEKLLPHDAKYFSTYQLQVRWDPSASCPTIINWMDKTIDSNLHNLIWQIIGVAWYPAMGFQQAIALIGGGKMARTHFCAYAKQLYQTPLVVQLI